MNISLVSVSQQFTCYFCILNTDPLCFIQADRDEFLNLEKQLKWRVWEMPSFHEGTFAPLGPASCSSHCCFITICLWPPDPAAFICTSVRTTPSLFRGVSTSEGLTHTSHHWHHERTAKPQVWVGDRAESTQRLLYFRSFYYLYPFF